MPARRKLSVVPRSDGGWAVTSGRTTLSTHRSKGPALAAGRRQAKRQVPSQLTIKGSDGRIQDQRSYEVTSGRSGSTTRRKTRATSKTRTRRTASATRSTSTSRSKRSTTRRTSGRGSSQKVRDIMTPNPRLLPLTATVGQAAETMRMIDAGTVLVADEVNNVVGIITDRDIAIRVVAEGRDPFKTMIGDVSTPSPATVTPDTSVRDAVKLMRERDIRRLPVVEGELAVGVVSLGDLAILQDPTSVLADISAAPSTDRGAARRATSRNIERTSPAGLPEDIVVLPESEEPVSTGRRGATSTPRR